MKKNQNKYAVTIDLFVGDKFPMSNNIFFKTTKVTYLDCKSALLFYYVNISAFTLIVINNFNCKESMIYDTLDYWSTLIY